MKTQDHYMKLLGLDDFSMKSVVGLMRRGNVIPTLSVECVYPDSGKAIHRAIIIFGDKDKARICDKTLYVFENDYTSERLESGQAVYDMVQHIIQDKEISERPDIYEVRDTTIQIKACLLPLLESAKNRFDSHMYAIPRNLEYDAITKMAMEWWIEVSAKCREHEIISCFLFPLLEAETE